MGENDGMAGFKARSRCDRLAPVSDAQGRTSDPPSVRTGALLRYARILGTDAPLFPRESQLRLLREREAPGARSSAISEDGSHASFAGQYLTLLNLGDVDAVFDAVRQCWASAFRRNAAAYSRALGHENVPRMAVLVQLQLAPRCAGVAFSVDPVSGERDKLVINAVSGLGERLVSGRASPDAWFVRGNEAVCERAPENCLTAGDAVAIAGLTRRVADYFNSPQDIEWAIAGDELHLLQARPITTLSDGPRIPVPVHIKRPHGFWERNVTSFPHPLSPMILREARASRVAVVAGISEGNWLFGA